MALVNHHAPACCPAPPLGTRGPVRGQFQAPESAPGGAPRPSVREGQSRSTEPRQKRSSPPEMTAPRASASRGKWASALTVLIGDDLPELGTDLVTALASLDVNDLAHLC